MRKSFSFRVRRVRTQIGTTLRDGGETQLRVDYRTMNKVDPYPKCKKEEELKITYTRAKEGKFMVTEHNTQTSVLFRESDRSAGGGFIFMNCLVPEDLDWKVGTQFNRKVKVVPKRRVK